METEALATAVAASGVLGIADVITRQLVRASIHGEMRLGTPYRNARAPRLQTAGPRTQRAPDLSLGIPHPFLRFNCRLCLLTAGSTATKLLIRFPQEPR